MKQAIALDKSEVELWERKKEFGLSLAAIILRS
jgi:hypothetical protein